VLKTLDTYIEESQSESGFLASLWSRLARDRRFSILLTLSFVFHLIFYAVIINLDFWAAQEHKAAGQPEGERVQFVEIAPSPDIHKRRPAPESLARVDINRLEYDPNNADDTQLLSRSPKPSTQRGNNGQLPSADVIERRARAARAAASQAVRPSPDHSQPPRTAVVTSSGPPRPDSPVIANAPVVQPAPAPPTPVQNPSANATASNAAEQAQAGARRGDSAESSMLGFERVQAQYIALVRAKIIREHRRSVPYEYVQDVLSRRVSADYEIEIARSGQLLSVRLLHKSGDSRLDALAREAIYMASPFEGYPQDAGDRISFIVKLYYDPFQ
jgi:outer membrane biosynthesis protein TonB